MATILNTINPFASSYEYFVLFFKENNIFYTIERNISSRSSFETQILNDNDWETVDNISESSILNSCNMISLNDFVDTCYKMLESGIIIDNISLIEGCLKDLRNGPYHGCENEIITLIDNFDDELILTSQAAVLGANEEYNTIISYKQDDYSIHNNFKANNIIMNHQPRVRTEQDVAA